MRLSRLRSAVAGAVVMTLVISAAPAQTEFTHTLELKVGDTAEVTGAILVGANVHNINSGPPPRPALVDVSCDGAVNHSCETIFIALEKGTLSLEAVPQVAASDFGLYVFAANEKGDLGAQLASSDGIPVLDDLGSVESVILAPEDLKGATFVIVWVVHWSTVGSYTLTAALTK